MKDASQILIDDPSDEKSPKASKRSFSQPLYVCLFTTTTLLFGLAFWLCFISTSSPSLNFANAENGQIRLVINNAIAEGVPAFNRGDTKKCSDLYMLAMQTILAMPEVPEVVSSRFEEAMLKADAATSETDSAWALRHGLDDALDELDKMETPQTASTWNPEVARGIIDDAIHKGVRMFNYGNSRGCADVYYEAMKTISQMQDIPLKVEMRFKQAMMTADRMMSQSKRAWTLRYGLDDVKKMISMMQYQPY